MSASGLLRRLERETLIVLAVSTVLTFLINPKAPRMALGVVGGGVLVGLAYWAIRGATDAVLERAITGENRPFSRQLALVKFFTRHAILAVAGYGMMTRLELHPIGLLIGVTSPAVAAGIEAARAAGKEKFKVQRSKFKEKP